MHRFVQLLTVLRFVANVEQCMPTNKCSSSGCYVMPPSPPMYQPAPSYPMPPPMYAMAPSIMPPPPPPPPPPPASMPMSMSMQIPMMAPHPRQIPMMALPDSSAPVAPASISSSANTYEIALSQESTRWDRQEPEYKHVDETDVVVAPTQGPEVTDEDVLVPDVVEEKSTDSEKVENLQGNLHENERPARMDLKFEEPEPAPFDNETVTFHAWFLR